MKDSIYRCKPKRRSYIAIFWAGISAAIFLIALRMFEWSQNTIDIASVVFLTALMVYTIISCIYICEISRKCLKILSDTWIYIHGGLIERKTPIPVHQIVGCERRRHTTQKWSKTFDLIIFTEGHDKKVYLEDLSEKDCEKIYEKILKLIR